MRTQQLNELLSILTYKRPHQSSSEQAFIERFIEPLAEHPNVIEYMKDEVGNVYVTTSFSAKTLFTAHVDTVHSTEGIQRITYDANLNLVYIDQESAKSTNCLGADDSAGMWIMMRLIDAGIGGTFAFFRGEERGGIGSSHAAQHQQGYFKDFDRAIAFDRRGQTSVITHQGMGRCCSDQFGAALAGQINLTGHVTTMRPDNTGVFTDTANLTDLIGECTNVSCGYEAEHSPNETLDVEFLFKLVDALLLVDFESLPTVRKPGERDPDDYSYSYGGWSYGAPSGSDYVAQDTDAVMRMSYSQMVKYIRKTDVDSLAEVMFDLIDRISLLEEERLDYDYPFTNDADYQQLRHFGTI
jgi:hypothetical protein